MRKLAAGFILIMALPLAAIAQAPNDTPRPETVPASPAEAPPPGAIPGESPEAGSIPGESPQSGDTKAAGTENDAYNICLRATRLFEQQEKAKGKAKTAEAPISASCKSEEQKPASYWQCMEKQAMEKIDFNTAHWRCGKQTKVLK